MRCGGSGFQSGRHEARLLELVRRRSDLGLDIDDLLRIARREAGEPLTDEESPQSPCGSVPVVVSLIKM
jgi:hypothetical protein